MKSCLALADAVDARTGRRETPGPLHGVPWAFKDLKQQLVSHGRAGRLSSATIAPPQTPVLVERLRRAGVLPDLQDQYARVRHGFAHI